MTTPARARYTGYRFPAEIIGHAVWLYFRFPLGLRMVEELLAARGIIVSHETVQQWARKFGQQFAHQIRERAGAENRIAESSGNPRHRPCGIPNC
jgi:putative transposase